MKKSIMVTQACLPDFDEYINEIRDIWDTHWLTNMGTKHEILQKQLINYLQVDNLSLFVNGHMALELLLQALEFEKGSEIITTPFTFVSTTHAIIRNGMKPVFCDIRSDNYTIDTSKIRNLITSKTVAILPVHVYGHVCNVDELQSIADEYGLKVIYDAAHAFGVKYNGKSIGTFGDASMYSFHATKVFNTIEGGAVTFHDINLEKKLYQLKNFGIKNQEEVNGIGSNAKMNEFAAAMGICNLRHVEDSINKRKKIVSRYRERLSEVQGLYIVPEQKDVDSNYAYMPVQIQSNYMGGRNGVYERLLKNNIFARKYFYPLTSDMACYSNMFDSYTTTMAKKVSDSILTLPLYPELSLDEVNNICDIITNN